jgi:TfoX/Sxy family transcriptional regulator of competence genes
MMRELLVDANLIDDRIEIFNFELNMSSNLDFVKFIINQLSDECEMSFRKMFGEYAIYSKGKVVALICDDQLFVKPTEEGKKYIGDFQEGIAYPGAKPSLLIDDKIEDGEWLSELIRITEKELPMPKKKKSSYDSRKTIQFV